MTDLSGTSVLHYRIVRPIGSGGMGVVYQAEDTKLGRRVALKFLPPALAADTSALERFQREARAASALNHPHICTIHAIEQADGVPFIAMELLDGESLDQRLASRPLAWEALVDNGVQVADALDAAHQRGIVHRDIKPANIFLTKDGRAKVLDFGVAKIVDAGIGDRETMAQTAAQALTGDGIAVGTIAYMSPEQARGETLDARSDIFSLCAVLYEMSTGRRAFDGKTSAVIFHRILEGAPEPPRAINPALPQKLEDIILRGLERDRDLRYQTAADLRADLKRLKRDVSSGTITMPPGATATGASRPLSSGAILAREARRHKGVFGILGVLMVVMVAATAYGIYSFVGRRDTPAAPNDPSQRMTVTRLTSSGDVQGCGSISPDGKYVVYCNFAGELKVRQVATGSTVALADFGDTTAFSPDGNYVYVATSNSTYPDGVLFSIPVFGGEPQRILVNLSGGVAPSPDGQRIAFLRPNSARTEVSLMIAEAGGGSERSLAVTKLGETWLKPSGLSWSADGKLISATQQTTKGGVRMQPAVVDVGSGKITPLGSRTWPDVGRTVWLPNNAGVLFSAIERPYAPFQFWIATYPAGHATRITNDVRGFGNFSVSVTADGSTIATVPWEIVSNLWSTNADATAPLVQWTSGVRMDGEEGIAIHGAGRVYYASTDGAETGIWSVEAAGGRPRKLARQLGILPTLPSDGRFVIFEGLHEDRPRVWRMQPDGSDARVLTRGVADFAPVVSPDGQSVYYVQAGTDSRLARVSPDGGDPTIIGGRSFPVDISSDGRDLLVRRAGARPYAIVDAATGTVKTPLSLPPDARNVKYGRRPDLVAFIVDAGGVGNVHEQPIAGGPARQLTKFTTGRLGSFDYSPDGSRLILSRGTRTGDVVLIRDFNR